MINRLRGKIDVERPTMLDSNRSSSWVALRAALVHILITWCKMRLLFSLQIILLATIFHGMASLALVRLLIKHLTADFNSLSELGVYERRMYRQMIFY